MALIIVIAAIGFEVWPRPAPLTPLQTRILTIARGEIGYQTSPSDSYCNRFSAFWHAGLDDCAPGLTSEEWCADFAAWVWHEAGVRFTYGQEPGDLNSASASFYDWGVAHHTWHRAGDGYVAQPGDVAIYGLDASADTAVHVAIVTSDAASMRGPDVINGDGSRTAFSIVETGTDQWKADLHDDGARLSGFVAPVRSLT